MQKQQKVQQEAQKHTQDTGHSNIAAAVAAVVAAALVVVVAAAEAAAAAAATRVSEAFSLCAC